MQENFRGQSSLPEIITLMYHRIDTIDTDPWGICVSPAHFDEQIKFLHNNFKVISAKDVINQLKSGKITDHTICITFDDGYADNYMHARPILEKYNCPATFFIATAFTNQTTPFWWDELEIILLHSKKLPGHLLLQLGNKSYEYTLVTNELTAEQWRQHTNWKWYDEPPTDRCAIFLSIWEKLRSLPYEEIKRQIALIRNWACLNDAVYTDRLPMNEQQLQELSKNNLFTIGMHTHTHSDLEEKEKHFQMEEILFCKNVLSGKHDIHSNYLAYPYGRYNHHTLEAVKELEIGGCFTTVSEGINICSDVSKLGRYQVFDGSITSFTNQMNSWHNKVANNSYN